MRIIFKCFSIGLIIIMSQSVWAQDNMNDLLVGESEAAIRDSRKLLEGYVNPFMKSVGIGMANGWYNTAKPHKKFGVDITATVSAVEIPEKDLFYDVADLDLEMLKLISVNGDSTATSAPTVFGPDTEVRYRYTRENGESYDVSGPGGIGLKEEFGYNFVPVPMIHIGIGLMKNTDLKIRYIPNIDQDDVKFRLWGVGVMHDVKQHIPGIKLLPFDLSGFVGYTSMDFELDLTDNSGASGENQRATMEARSLTVQGLISKKFSVLTLYGGLGYNHVSTEVNLLGKYSVEDGNGNPVLITDPITDMDFPAGGPRITAGMRIKLLILTIHADYTLQEYSTITAGVGLSIRN